MDADSFIDRYPEVPFFLLTLIYVLTTPPDRASHVIAFSSLYMVFAVLLGFLLKYALHTARPRKYDAIPWARYDIPSMHSMISAGATFYLMVVKPTYLVFLIPLTYMYMQSRIRLRVHTKKAIYVGFILGSPIGLSFGLLVDKVSLTGFEMPLILVFFVLPAALTAIQRRYYFKSESSEAVDD